jgi:solute carrier family 25 phosphate transporter 3
MANSNMPLLFPSQSCLHEVFANRSPFSRPAPKPRSSEHPLKRPIFSAWSVAESAEAAKAKAGQLTDAAVDKYEKASAKAQAQAGAIELYSGKYYAACTFGGIIACVGGPPPPKQNVLDGD